MNPIVIPEKYKLPARNFLDALDKRLGSRQATAEFILEAGKPLAEAYLGVPVTRDTAKLVLAAAIDAIYSDARPVPVEPPKPSAPVPTDSPDFAEVTKWYGKSRGTWPQTVIVSNVRVEGGQIAWDEAKGQREARGWNVVSKGKSCNGETNLIIPSIKAAGCFDFLGVGQTRKTTGNLFPSKDGREQGMFAPWTPKKGERIGFYICTLNRHGVPEDMKHERSNVVWFTWP